MKVSIITVCFNSAATIRTAIESVLGQSHNDIEYIVIDGQSNDGTQAIIEEYTSEIDHWASEPDNGIYDAMNKGIQRATGDIVGILNSDDIYADEKVIEDVVSMLNATKSDACYADLVYVSEDLNQVKRTWISGEYRPNSFLYGWMPPHPTFFVKRSVYQRLGDFNLKLRSAADYELMLRFIHKHSISLSYLPRVIVKMRQGGQSNASLSNRKKANKEDVLAWSINGLKPYWYTMYLKPLRKIPQFFKRK